MSAYIGPLGGLVEIECPSDLRPTMERPFAEKSTTSGIVRQQVSQRTRRQWDFATSVATPAQAAQLAAIVAGEFGYGPFWFVDPWAQVTNLLSPAWSTFDHDAPLNTIMGGPVDLADGNRAGRSLMVPDPGTGVTLPRTSAGIHRVPVLPGQRVTVSVYASGSDEVSVRQSWVDAEGELAGSSNWSTYTPGHVPDRVRRTSTIPDGVAGVALQVLGANRLARPAITWSELHDWHVGQGAPTVAIPATLGQDIILATRDARGGRYAAVSTTIREVG